MKLIVWWLSQGHLVLVVAPWLEDCFYCPHLPDEQIKTREVLELEYQALRACLTPGQSCALRSMVMLQGRPGSQRRLGEEELEICLCHVSKGSAWTHSGNTRKTGYYSRNFSLRILSMMPLHLTTDFISGAENWVGKLWLGKENLVL